MVYTTTINWEQELPTIRKMGVNGDRMVTIARHYGVTRQRMKQVLDRHIPDWKDNYGGAVIRKRVAEEYTKKWGDRQATDLYLSQRAKFRRKKANAVRTGFTWTIEFGELDWPTHCPILGLELDYFSDYCKEESPSFDRIDSSFGYDSGNVQVISWRANRIKNNGTAQEHRLIADYLDKLENKEHTSS
jgi:hypothetical protein